jgi:hypothetical protein
MKKICLLLALFLMTGSFGLYAQTLRNTQWKGFFGDPLNDTLTIHFHTDSSFVSDSHGGIIVVSHFSLSGDTLHFKDTGGQYPCMDQDGVYKWKIDGSTLLFALINDSGCEGRTHIVDVKWIRAAAKP